MPFVQIYLPETFTAALKKEISLCIHDSLIEIFKIPKDDYFHVISELKTENLIYPASYLNVSHTSNLLYIYITCGTGRTVEMKKNLYAAIADKISTRTSVTKDDVIIILNETAWENWSFGQGRAQMIK
ncbi:tautomerase family protein [Mucilaginibacter sp.]|uniref:tautomerase family protein n=1 Tax=Mucilaginibacter sp. TaxID=1882438 RepID=UPI0035BC2624